MYKCWVRPDNLTPWKHALQLVEYLNQSWRYIHDGGGLTLVAVSAGYAPPQATGTLNH